MTDLIYRIVAANGRGAYQGGLTTMEGNKVEYWGPRHPAPYSDNIPDEIIYDPGSIYGFDGLEEARRWFYEPEDVKAWAARGAKLRVYPRAQVKRVFPGFRQVAFYPKEDAKYVDLPASDLYASPDKIAAKVAKKLKDV